MSVSACLFYSATTVSIYRNVAYLYVLDIITLEVFFIEHRSEIDFERLKVEFFTHTKGLFYEIMLYCFGLIAITYKK